jgi:colicin import membrane protein
MTRTARPHDALLPRQPGGMAPGAALALLVHGGLLLALTTAVNWRMRTPDTVVSAELWASVPQVAAPRAAEAAPPPPLPPPAPAPEPPPAPAPAPVAVPKPAPPPPPAAAAARADADIALERQKAERQKAEREQAERDKLDREKRQAADTRRLADEQRALEARRTAEREKKAREQAERAKLERDKLDREQKARSAEAERQKLAEAEKKKREAAAKEAQAEEARLAKQREENLKRMLGQATTGATGAATASGSAAADAAPSANYTGRLVALIRSNIVFTGSAEANAAAEVEVRAGPSGTIISHRLTKASGQPDWDEAVLRAIDRTARLPRDSDGRVPPVIIITFKPRE